MTFCSHHQIPWAIAWIINPVLSVINNYDQPTTFHNTIIITIVVTYKYLVSKITTAIITNSSASLTLIKHSESSQVFTTTIIDQEKPSDSHLAFILSHDHPCSSPQVPHPPPGPPQAFGQDQHRRLHRGDTTRVWGETWRPRRQASVGDTGAVMVSSPWRHQ